jgi:hypothetical protein
MCIQRSERLVCGIQHSAEDRLHEMKQTGPGHHNGMGETWVEKLVRFLRT